MSSIPFHPLANMFPLLEGADFEELVADIKAHGQHEEIVIFDRMILDGRNRYRACLTAGITPKLTTYDGEGDDPVAFVISKNLRRRHLTADQKRELIAKLLKAKPEQSDRQIAETVKASPTTVGKVRAKVEPTVQNGQLTAKRVGKDGKSRKQPAQRPQYPAKPKPKMSAIERRLHNHLLEANAENMQLRTRVGDLEFSAGLVAAWLRAGDDERRSFVLEYRTELSRAQQDAERKCIKKAADRAEARAAASTDPHPLDIPVKLRRSGP